MSASYFSSLLQWLSSSCSCPAADFSRGTTIAAGSTTGGASTGVGGAGGAGGAGDTASFGPLPPLRP